MSLRDTVNRVLTKTLAAFDQRKAKAADDYRMFVRDFVEKTDKYSQKELENKLEQFDIEPKQFQIDCDAMVKRIELVERVSRIPALAARSDAIYATLAQADADYARRLDELGREFAALVDPLSDEIKVITANLTAARRDESAARSGCTDAALHAQLAAVEQRRRAVSVAGKFLKGIHIPEIASPDYSLPPQSYVC